MFLKVHEGSFVELEPKQQNPNAAYFLLNIQEHML